MLSVFASTSFDEQETRNFTVHEAQPSAVLNFEFLVRERVSCKLNSAAYYG